MSNQIYLILRIILAHSKHYVNRNSVNIHLDSWIKSVIIGVEIGNGDTGMTYNKELIAGKLRRWEKYLESEKEESIEANDLISCGISF